MRRLPILLPLLLAGCAGPRPVVEPAGATSASFDRPFPVQRADMVSRIRADIAATAPSALTPGLTRTLAAVATIPREAFVKPEGRRLAYLRAAQAIGWDQTISDPHIVAVMTAALDLRPGANVLDVGTGSGYQAAVLDRLGVTVASIEIVEPLAREAAARLKRLGFMRVGVRAGDGYAGWPERAPFDGIVVAAGTAAVPQPLIDQLRVGGRLVMPIGANTVAEQILVLTKQTDGSTTRCSLGPAMFVPLTGVGARPEARYALRDRSIPLCYGAAVT